MLAVNFNNTRMNLFVAFSLVLVFLDLVWSENTGDVLYLNVPEFRGTMCQASDTSFNDTNTSSRANCAVKCAWHPGCHSIFYDRDWRLCVGCAQRYTSAADATASGLDTLHSRGICDVSLVSGLYGIPDRKITVSSHYVEAVDPELHGPKYSRLNTVWTVPGSGAWASASTDPVDHYIQAEFYNLKFLTSVLTQGRPDNPHYHMWVTAYEVHYSLDCDMFIPVMTPTNVVQLFPANVDRDTIVTNTFVSPFYARCVRINVVSYFHYISLRFDLVGCA